MLLRPQKKKKVSKRSIYAAVIQLDNYKPFASNYTKRAFSVTLVLQRTTTIRKWIFTSNTFKTITVYKVFNVIMTMSVTSLSYDFIN